MSRRSVRIWRHFGQQALNFNAIWPEGSAKTFESTTWVGKKTVSGSATKPIPILKQTISEKSSVNLEDFQLVPFYEYFGLFKLLGTIPVKITNEL